MSIEEYRKKMIEVTGYIIELIGKREELARKIAEAKKENDLEVDDVGAEERLIENMLSRSVEAKADKETVLKILSALIADSKKLQRAILGIKNAGPSQQKLTPMAMASIAMEFQRSGKRLYRLDIGEPDFEPPRRVVEACCNAIASFKTHYTQTRGIPELLTSLSRYLKRKQNYDAKEDQLIITPGGRFAIYAALSSILKEGESAIIVEPNWPMYKEAIEFLGCRCISIHTKVEENWEPSVEEISSRVREHTKAIILSYPCNPTGKIISRDKFREIIEEASRHHLTVLSDEIYNAYAYKDCPSILDFEIDNFVLTSSFSKAWAMTGFRIGYALSSPDMIERMMKIASLMITSVPEFVQYAAIAALDCDDVVEANSRKMKRRIEIATNELDKIDALEYMKPDGGMYVFPKIKTSKAKMPDFAMKLLTEKKVSISPGTGFGTYPDHFRISLGQSDNIIREGIKRIGEALS